MEKIIRNVPINPGGTIYNRTRQCLAYVDDVVILERSEGYTKKTLEEMVAITQQIGLQMNDKDASLCSKQPAVCSHPKPH
jgi:hypothetical protein